MARQVGMAPLARLQYTLEQYRNGTIAIPENSPSIKLAPPRPPGAREESDDIAHLSGALGEGHDANTSISGGDVVAADVTLGEEEEEAGATGMLPIGEDGWSVIEDQSRLLPPVVVPQVNACDMCYFPPVCPSAGECVWCMLQLCVVSTVNP